MTRGLIFYIYMGICAASLIILFYLHVIVKNSYVNVILVAVIIIAVGAAALFLLQPAANQPEVPGKTTPELFATIQDTDGAQQTPSNAEGIITDSKGNVYASLLAERAVVIIDQNGAQRIFARVPGNGSLLGLAVDATDNIYVADANFGDPQRSCNCIRKITQEGNVTIFASGIPIPNGLVFDRDGNLLVASSGQGAIYKVDKEGRVSLFLDDDLLKSHSQRPIGANGIAVTMDGTIYVTNTGDSSVIRIKDGNVSIFGSANDFPGADGVALDSAGNLYIAQNSVNTISALTPRGAKVIVAQNGNSTGVNGELEAPASLAFYQDRLYVSNADFPGGTNSKTETPYTISVLKIGITGQ